MLVPVDPLSDEESPDLVGLPVTPAESPAVPDVPDVPDLSDFPDLLDLPAGSACAPDASSALLPEPGDLPAAVVDEAVVETGPDVPVDGAGDDSPAGDEVLGVVPEPVAPEDDWSAAEDVVVAATGAAVTVVPVVPVVAVVPADPAVPVVSVIPVDPVVPVDSAVPVVPVVPVDNVFWVPEVVPAVVCAAVVVAADTVGVAAAVLSGAAVTFAANGVDDGRVAVSCAETAVNHALIACPNC